MTSETRSFKSQPVNVNQFQPTRFQFVFARLPHVTYFAQNIILPGVSTTFAPQPTPFVDRKLPGDKLVYEPITATFLVDENLQNWREVHDWLRGMTFPTKFEEYRALGKLNEFAKNLERPQYSDLTVILYSNAQLPVLRYKFYDAFPISLGAITLSTQDNPDSPVVADVTLEYQYFDIEAV